MATYKLYYFNMRGRAEMIRMLFAIAGVPYEDVRVERDQWQALKPDMPFGQIPVLEVNGVKMCQGYAIARYLARQFGLMGKDNLDQLRVDMIVDCIEDIIKSAVPFIFQQDATKKAEMKKTFCEETGPTLLNLLERLLLENNNGDYFVGNELTLADVAWSCWVKWLTDSGVPIEVIDGYPKLKALADRVERHPKIAAWIAKRPVNER